MRKLIFATLSLFVMSCSTPELEANPGYEVQQTIECGTVTKVEYTPNGAYIYVKTESGSAKYKVNEYMSEDWTKGKLICDFTGLTKV